MSLWAIKKRALPSFVENLGAEFLIAGPKAREFRHAFGDIGSFPELSLGYDTTLLPPKKYLLPQKETLFTYTTGDRPVVAPVFDETRRVIFGAHSCDINGIWLLDDVFAEGCQDAHYLTRRRNTLIVGLACATPCSENSFCKSMGTLRPAGGYDLFLTPLDDIYVVESGTRAGGLLLKMGEFFEADFTMKELFYAVWRKNIRDFPDRLGYDAARLPHILAEAYDDAIWDDLELRCFDCGACTVVCPTCYCFDVSDEADLGLTGGGRYRRWDSCQLRDFAAVAGGTNFRGKRSDRLRHRLLRKGKYFKEKFDRFACVGCGRCGKACLVDIDVLDIFRRLGGQGVRGQGPEGSVP